MADNYLEKKYEAVFGAGASRKTVVKHANPTLDSLLLRNRSHRGYSQGYVVEMQQLETVISVNTRIPSARNQQVLRFLPVTASSGADIVLEHIALGGALPELHLPASGEEPRAFIIVCTSVPETRYVDIDLGISLQSMSLKAVEMGLNCVTVCAFDKVAIKSAFGLGSEMEPLAILAVGKGTDNIQLLSIRSDEDHRYYRKDGVHYVPKLTLDDLIIRR